MHYHTMTIAGLERQLPICPVNENLSIGAFVIFGDAPLTVACAKALLERAPEYDYIITACLLYTSWESDSQGSYPV